MGSSYQSLKPGHFVIMPTFRCNAKCVHCQHSCSSQRDEVMDLALFRSVVLQALDTGCKALCLSGGEPFLLPDYIHAAADVCRRQNHRLVIQTNGFWGGDRARACALLEGLQNVTQIGFSVDTSHMQQIPIDNLLGAIEAAIDSEITRISVSVAYRTKNEYSLIKQIFAQRFPGIEVTGWPVLPVGRAVQHAYLWENIPAHSWDCLQRNCGAQLEFCPIVHPNGDLHFCYRVVMALERRDPLIIGNLTDTNLADLLATQQSSLAMFIVSYGGGGLGYLLRDSPFENLLDAHYINVCHFCYDILARADVVNYLTELLGTAELRLRVVEEFEHVHKSGEKKERTSRKETIVVCNGSRCASKGRSYSIINYLNNRLVESGRRFAVDIEVIDCLKACAKGPNILLKSQNRMIHGVTKESIDSLLDDIVPLTICDY